MALQRFNIGNNEDGSPRFHYISDGPVVITAPSHQGDVVLADGTVYNVSPEVVEVASVDHAQELAALISGELDHPAVVAARAAANNNPQE